MLRRAVWDPDLRQLVYYDQRGRHRISVGGGAVGPTGPTGPTGAAGDQVTVNSGSTTNVDLDDATPAAPSGDLNVKWQTSGVSPSNVSAYVDVSALEPLLSRMVDERFGDSSDGAVTMVGNLSLSADKNYTTFDLAGFDLDTNGYWARCSELLTDDGTGTISHVGGAGGAPGGGTNTAGSLGAGGNGATGRGTVGNGATGSGRTFSWPAKLGATLQAGTGGAAGAPGGQTGGAGGSAAAPGDTLGWGSAVQAETGHLVGGNTVSRLHGGAGGGAGGNQTASGFSGGGGGGGGVCMVFAYEVDCPSGTVIHADGGAGGNATLGASVGVGGGGGGNGGYSQLMYEVGTSLPTVRAAGGGGGAGAGAGAAGVAGSAGVASTRPTRV